MTLNVSYHPIQSQSVVRMNVADDSSEDDILLNTKTQVISTTDSVEDIHYASNISEVRIIRI